MEKWTKLVKGNLETYPTTFVLVRILNAKGNTFKGWWTGQDWDGYQLERFGNIVEWKHIHK